MNKKDLISGRMEHEEKLAQVCSVTGEGVEAARHLLEAADGDVELAISLFFDSTGGATNNNVVEKEEEVRAPIAPQRTRITSEGPSIMASSLTFHVPEPFAESARENPDNPTAARLAALYKPPTELVHQPATLEAARNTARSRGIPLLVSLYDPTIFPCHVENRDLWNNAVVWDYIKSGHVIFLQLVFNGGPLDEGSGELYAGRYAVQPPHIGIIDAQTGELLREFKSTPSPMDLLSALSDHIDNDIGEEEDDDVQVEECFLYEEPEIGTANITTIMFRLGNGRRVPKRFLLDATPEIVYKVAAQLSECSVGEIVLKSSPHESIDSESCHSLKELQLQNSLVTVASKK